MDSLSISFMLVASVGSWLWLSCVLLIGIIVWFCVVARGGGCLFFVGGVVSLVGCFLPSVLFQVFLVAALHGHLGFGFEELGAMLGLLGFWRYEIGCFKYILLLVFCCCSF
ncbi:hypothetical protein M5K25_008717 [Dendrobium thyrsiflorum]|uniref:Transmembrane protein n=1 Tax=Dendrobium thyrsiflorum TaxID=117978 RepID=A0ABD0V9H6_DENTH